MHPEEVACMVAFTPTFLAKEAKPEKIEICQGEKPEISNPKPEGTHLFIFIVDRSGSMNGDKMNITIESLKLFLQSLPSGSRFDIISFGSKFKTLGDDFDG
jgi:Mg-chelatase subunit ChlD